MDVMNSAEVYWIVIAFRFILLNNVLLSFS
jgi:hypothetical protein